jgi:Tfp pilus assembly protein PilE
MYNITMVRTPTTYTLTAVPLAAEQVKDTLCGSFTIDNTGKKLATGSTPTKCW